MSTHLVRKSRLVAVVLVALAAGHMGCRHRARADVVVVASAPPPPQPVVATQAQVDVDGDVTSDVAVDDFNEPLANYGAWVYDPRYGRVWQPAPDMAGPDFMPYGSDGTWVVNADGDWVFRSRYHAQWGWATYHYGRWAWNDSYGWVWVPGRAWAPAWVEWRYGGGYVGWVPMGPPGVVVHQHHWVFVDRVHIGSPTVWSYRVPRDRVHVAFAAATPIVEVRGHSRWRAGPPMADIRASGAALETVHVATPAQGYVRAQGRASIDAAADRRASGRVSATPYVRGNAGASAGPDTPMSNVPNRGADPSPPGSGPGTRAAPIVPGAGGRPDTAPMPPGQVSKGDSRVEPRPLPAQANPPGQVTKAEPRPLPAQANPPGQVSKVEPRPANPIPAPGPAPEAKPVRPAPPAPAPGPAARPAKPAAATPAKPAKPAAGKKRK